MQLARRDRDYIPQTIINQINSILSSRRMTFNDMRNPSTMVHQETTNSIISLMHLAGIGIARIRRFTSHSKKHIKSVIQDKEEPRIRTVNYEPRGSRGRRVGRKATQE